MYKITYRDQGGIRHTSNRVSTIREALTTTVSLLVDIQVEPHKARRFALHLSRQPLGTEIENKPTGWRFRIDETEE